MAVFAFIIICSAVFAADSINGFTVDLIHRDLPNSPFYNPSQTHAERIRDSIRRSSDRINRRFINHLNNGNNQNSVMKTNNDLPTADLYTIGGAYVMSLSIGSPPVQFLAIADTGSGITWTQCQPCENCYQQKIPIFDPKASSSYKQLACDSPICTSSGGRCENSVCTYEADYLDKTYTKGHLASETFQVGPVTVPNLVFGCGTNNSDDSGMQDGSVSGIVGLDRSPSSLITQLGPSINGKFSYCLVPSELLQQQEGDKGSSSSKMKFGTDAIVYGDGTVVTPLIVQKNVPAGAYYITLLGISVGSERFDFPAPATSGNLIVDLGSTYTHIPTDLFNKVAESLKRQSKKPVVKDESKTICFHSTDDILDPGLTLNIDGGDLVLASYNYFRRVTTELTCLTVIPDDRITILGNLAQMNYLVGYDLQANTLSFKGSDCTM